MRNTPLSILLILLLFSCAEQTSSETAELTDIIHRLRTDSGHEFLSTFVPTEADLEILFIPGSSLDSVIAYSNLRWAGISKVPDGSMKPETDDAILKILSVTKEELAAGRTNGLPDGYLEIAEHLRDGTKLYAMQYLNEDETEQKMRSAFFKAGDNWVMIPLVYRAFE